MNIFILKPIRMKKSFALFLFLLILFIKSFSQSPKPDNIIHSRKSEFVGWTFDSTVGKPIQAIDSFYLVRPTWAQAHYYASKRPDKWTGRIVGGVLLTGSTIASYGVYAGAAWLPELSTNAANALFFTGTAGGFQSLVNNTYGIKWNNNKWISKSSYHHYMNTAGSLHPFWDSLEANYKIVDGPYKKKK